MNRNQIWTGLAPESTSPANGFVVFVFRQFSSTHRSEGSPAIGVAKPSLAGRIGILESMKKGLTGFFPHWCPKCGRVGACCVNCYRRRPVETLRGAGFDLPEFSVEGGTLRCQ